MYYSTYACPMCKSHELEPIRDEYSLYRFSCEHCGALIFGDQADDTDLIDSVQRAIDDYRESFLWAGDRGQDASDD